MCVAGLPMAHGGALSPGYVPEIDATVVTRILEAGGEITGKTTCEWGCISGGSHTSSSGPVPNPYNGNRTAGGSSSGSAVVVATGEADMALGTDQGGSIRIPASYCGVYGLKPTFGLVPYSGIASLEASIDHCGPITRTAGDNAILLDAIAGPDGLDERLGWALASPCTAALEAGVRGLRIGLLKEGFGTANTDPEVDQKVLAAARRLETLGASSSGCLSRGTSRGRPSGRRSPTRAATSQCGRVAASAPARAASPCRAWPPLPRLGARIRTPRRPPHE